MKLHGVRDLMIKENWKVELRALVDEAIEDYDALEKVASPYEKLKKLGEWLEKYGLLELNGKVIYSTLREEIEKIKNAEVIVGNTFVLINVGHLRINLKFHRNFIIETQDLSDYTFCYSGHPEPSKKMRALVYSYREKNEERHGRLWIAKKLYSDNKVDDEVKGLRKKWLLLVDALKIAFLYEEKVERQSKMVQEYDEYLMKKEDAYRKNWERDEKRDELIRSSGIKSFLEKFKDEGFKISSSGIIEESFI